MVLPAVHPKRPTHLVRCSLFLVLALGSCGATSTNLSGQFKSYPLTRTPTSASAASVAITSTSEPVKLFSTSATVKTQAGPP